MRPPLRSRRGTSLAEALVAVAVVALALAVALPAASGLRNRALLDAAAREMALTLQALRWRAVASQRAHGLWFRRDARGWYWYEVRDGNGNGVRLSEVASGVDLLLRGPERLERLVSGVSIGLPEGRLPPEIPPRPGRVPPGTLPVRFGTSGMAVASPQGSATSGTLFLTDRAGGLRAVVVAGATARVRVWRYHPGHETWTR